MSEPARLDPLVPVIFRKWKDGRIVALFPTTPTDYTGNHMFSYENTWEHPGVFYYDVVRYTTSAKPEEYAELATELERMGYRLLPVKRVTAEFNRQRYAAAQQFMQEVG